MQQNRILQIIALVLLLFASTFAICEEQEDVVIVNSGGMKVVKLSTKARLSVLGKTDTLALFRIDNLLRCVNLKTMKETWTIDLKREDEVLYLETCLFDSSTLSLILSSWKEHEKYAMIYRLENDECKPVFEKIYTKKPVGHDFFARASNERSEIRSSGKWVTFVCNGSICVVDIEEVILNELLICNFRVNETCISSRGIYTLKGIRLTQQFDYKAGKQLSTCIGLSEGLLPIFEIMLYRNLIICQFPNDLLQGVSATSPPKPLSKKPYCIVLNYEGAILFRTKKGFLFEGGTGGCLYFRNPVKKSNNEFEQELFEYNISTRKMLKRGAYKSNLLPGIIAHSDQGLFYQTSCWNEDGYFRIFHIDSPDRVIVQIKSGRNYSTHSYYHGLFSYRNYLAGKNIDKICEALGLEFEVCKQEKGK